MKNPLVNFLSGLSRATLDPALGGRGLALSRVLSLAAFAVERGDTEALAVLSEVSSQITKVINEGRDLVHEEWNDLQATAESGHWFLRSSYPQRGRDGGITGGHEVVSGDPVPAEPVPPVADVPKPVPPPADTAPAASSPPTTAKAPGP